MLTLVKAALERLKLTTDLREAVASADLVNECVLERLDLKTKIFTGETSPCRIPDDWVDVLSHCSSSCVLSSNTMSLSISEIAAKLKEPEVWLRHIAVYSRLDSVS